MTRTYCGVLGALLLWLVTSPAVAQTGPTIGVGPPGHEREATWLYDSPLCVQETITDYGGGAYLYSYSFTNVDSAHIWHFGVWSHFSPVNSVSTWSAHPIWSFDSASVDAVYPAYDGRNLDPNIASVANTYAQGWQTSTDVINPGDTVSGFAYYAYGYDASPKYYFYETTESGYAGATGPLAAVGQTCTEPTPVQRRSWGKIKSLYRGNN